MKIRKIVPLMIAALVTAPIPLGAALAQSAAAEPDDAAIVSAVKSALAAKPELKADKLKISSKKGEVSIDGDVEDGQQLFKIAQTAETVAGVKAVINGMQPKK
jgi:osmotically-inducible protein OsmY